SVAFTYDRADRVVHEQAAHDVQMTYDRRSLETSVTTPSGIEFDYQYTARGELDKIKSGSTTYADQTFDPAGNLIRRDLGNRLSTTWTYDARNVVTLIDPADGASALLNLKYNFDAAGRMLEQRNVPHVTRSETYSYDAADRLVLYHGKVPPLRKAPPLQSDPLK